MTDIVIVNWNGGDLVKKCIGSVFENSGIGLVNSVIVVDNASTDNSADNLPNDKRLIVIKNTANFGFARACNQGFKLCKAEFVLLLNPDAQILPSTLQECIAFINQNPGVDILGARLLDDNGKNTFSCARFPTPLRIFFDAAGLSKLFPTVFTPSTLMTDWNHAESRFVDQLMGAFMFMRRSVFDKIGYFDERFFVYYEELDFSKRLSEAGGKSFYNHDITAIHSGEGTTSRVKAFRLFLSLRSRLQYAKKHFSSAGYIFVFLSTWLVEPFSRTLLHLVKGQWSSVKNVWQGYGLLFKNKL